MWVAKQFFSKCQRFAVALDGTRVGRYGYNLVVVVGTGDSGASLSVWCPPQALLHCAGGVGDMIEHDMEVPPPPPKKATTSCARLCLDIGCAVVASLER